ncbi:MAG: hypothetical protein ABIP48_32245 [Planctomycetota bacterium]
MPALIRIDLFLTILATCFGGTSTLPAHGPKVDDRVVVLREAPLRVSSDTVGTAAPGDVLSVERLQGPWLWVRHQDRQGWIESKHATADPQAEFVELVSLYRCRQRFGAIDKSSPRHSLTLDEFRQFTMEPATAGNTVALLNLMDRNGDGSVSRSEFSGQPSEAICLRLDGLTLDQFLPDTERPTLDVLNQRLHKVIDTPEKRRIAHMIYVLKGIPSGQTIGGDDLLTMTDLVVTVLGFEGWDYKKEPTYQQAREIVEQFVRTGDVRRSRQARDFVPSETQGARSQRALAIFKWADSDGDGKLTVREIAQAYGDGAAATERSRP